MSEVKQETKADVILVAEALGLVPFFRTDEKVLMLDLDTSYDVLKDQPWPEFPLKLHQNENTFVEEPVSLLTKSKSGNAHLYVRLSSPITTEAAIAIQAAMGSDPVRETLSALQLMQGSERGCVIALFETPEEAKNVEKFMGSDLTDFDLMFNIG